MKTLSIFLLALLSALDPARAQTVGEACPMRGSTALSTCQVSGPGYLDPITIPVVVHVISDENGQGDVPLSDIEDQIAVMNAAFGLDNYLDGPRFQFSLAGVGRVQNTSWHTMPFNQVNLDEAEGQAKRALNVEPEHVLNLYLANPTTSRPNDLGPYGWAVFPFEYEANDGVDVFFPEDHFMQGVVIDFNTLPGGFDPRSGYDEGDTGPHEVGHYLGLYHTWGHEGGGCTDDDCIGDTPNHRASSGSCSDNAGCDGEGDPPVENLMNYAPDDCRFEFTEGQFDRMEGVVADFRPVLAEGLPAPLIIDERQGDESDPVVWTNETFEGEDLYLLGGGAVTVPAGANVVLKADAQGNPTTLYVNGTLTGEENITVLDGSEIVCRFGSSCDMGGGLTASGTSAGGGGACILAKEGSTVTLSGTSTFSDGALFVNAGGTVILDDFATIDMASDAGRFEATPGSVFRFGADAAVTIGGQTEITGTAAEPVVFEGDGLLPGQTWGGLVIAGHDAEVAYAEIADATWGLQVRAYGASLDHLTLDGNGLATDYVACPPPGPPPQPFCALQRSGLSLSNSTITGSVGHGLVLRNTDATVTNTTVSGNDGYGLVVWNADVYPFTGNTVSGNGFPTTRDGILVHANGDLRLSMPSSTGLNAVTGNSRYQLHALSGSYLFIGAGDGVSVSGYNTITAGPASGPILLRNDSGSPVFAEYTWWGDPAGPPPGAFTGGTSVVDAVPFLTEPPFGGARQAGGKDVLAEAGGPSERGPGEDIDLDTLLDELLALREAVSQRPDAPEAPAQTRALYLLQRLDHADALGERAATMALLTTLRENLDEPDASPSLRHTGEAALGAEVAEALLQEEYDVAEALLASYADATVEEGWLALTLSAVALDEQAGRYEAALALLEEAAALLTDDEAAELELIAALIEERLAEAPAGRSAGDPTASKAAGPSSEAASRAGDAALPAKFALGAAYPNPTARGATVPFELPEAAEVRLVVYDLLGREVAVLAEGRHEAGRHKAAFEASRLSAGVYVIRAEIAPSAGAAQAFTQKLTLLR